MTLRIGTRSSPLALIQAQHVQYALQTHGISSHLVPITTTGDQVADRPLKEIGGKGLFTKEIENQLYEGAVDLAVHSVKDLETFLPDGLTLACVLPREDPRDAFISRLGVPFTQIPLGSVLGTCSPRRQAQALSYRADLTIVSLRGNIGTRLKKVEEKKIDGTFLAVAGLKRLGWQKYITEILDAEWMIPAAGQGAIGIQCRRKDASLRALLESLNDPQTYQCVSIERSFLAGVEGTCHTAVGAYATQQNDGTFQFLAMIATEDGHSLRRTQTAYSSETALQEVFSLGQDYRKWLHHQTISHKE